MITFTALLSTLLDGSVLRFGLTVSRVIDAVEIKAIRGAERVTESASNATVDVIHHSSTVTRNVMSSVDEASSGVIKTSGDSVGWFVKTLTGCLITLMLGGTQFICQSGNCCCRRCYSLESLGESQCGIVESFVASPKPLTVDEIVENIMNGYEL